MASVAPDRRAVMDPVNFTCSDFRPAANMKSALLVTPAKTIFFKLLHSVAKSVAGARIERPCKTQNRRHACSRSASSALFGRERNATTSTPVSASSVPATIRASSRSPVSITPKPIVKIGVISVSGARRLAS